MLEELKQSTRQRFVAIQFRCPDARLERRIVARESGAEGAVCAGLVRLAEMTRNLEGSGLL